MKKLKKMKKLIKIAKPKKPELNIIIGVFILFTTTTALISYFPLIY